MADIRDRKTPISQVPAQGQWVPRVYSQLPGHSGIPMSIWEAEGTGVETEDSEQWGEWGPGVRGEHDP